jgi:branched-chain amino acid transport system ATP-binding protein
MEQPTINTPLFSAEHLSSGHVPGQASISDCSFELSIGQVVAVLGPNGAGKTTLLRALMGFLPLYTGRIMLGGHDISHSSTEQRAASGMALVPEGRGSFASLSVLDNLRLGLWRRNVREHSAALEAVWQRFPWLYDRRQQLAGTLSGGEQQLLAIERAVLTQPRLLLLDEPSIGLAPNTTTLVFERIQALQATGMGLIVVEQHIARALACANTVVVLAAGRVVAHAAANTLSPAQVVGRYLG